ncbi:MAG: hypothetical protein CM1200mP14_23900 [Gammaproteobacteria bacterium]|nr:MAG: hypothetical protein CM1200mP14_23900 [Gammaproteobacteria bacterium]
MTLSRRDAIKVSGSAVAGLSMGVVDPENVLSQTAPEQEWPDQLVEGDLRVRAELPLNADGSAPEHPESAAGELIGKIWRFSSDRRQPPADIDYDYNNLRIRLDSRGLAKMSGTLKFSDLEAYLVIRWSRCFSVVHLSQRVSSNGLGSGSVILPT